MVNSLTYANEELKGFVGRRNLKFDYTDKDNKPRLTFDLGIKQEDLSRNIAPVWRHCIVYGDLAEEFKRIRPGFLLVVTGWLAANYILDAAKNRVEFEGEPVSREKLIVESIAVCRLTDDRQLAFRPVAVPGDDFGVG